MVVQGVDCIRQVDAKVVPGVQLSGLCDQALSKVGVNFPVAFFVGVGQRGTLDRSTDTHVVQLRRLRGQANLDVAKALSVSQLSKGQDAKLVGARQCSNAVVSLVSRHRSMKSFPRKKIHELSKECLPRVHKAPDVNTEKQPILPYSDSNRGHLILSLTH